MVLRGKLDRTALQEKNLRRATRCIDPVQLSPGVAQQQAIARWQCGKTFGAGFCWLVRGGAGTCWLDEGGAGICWLYSACLHGSCFAWVDV